jgi:hypothetical protein
MRGLALVLILSACAQDPQSECVEWRIVQVPKHRDVGSLSVEWVEDELLCVRRS